MSLLIIFSCLLLASADCWEEIKLNMDKLIATNHFWFTGNKPYFEVRPGRPLDIILIGCVFPIVECSSHLYGFEIPDAKFMTNGRDRTIIKVDSVTSILNNIWMCTLKDYNQPPNQHASIYFDIHVEHAKPTQLILVNRVVLPTRKVPNREFDHTAIYYYEIGDTVDVTCVNPEDGFVQMNYDYASAFNEEFTTMSSNYAVGFHIRFDTKHNNSIMVCKCDSKGFVTYVKVIFKQKEYDDIMHLNINGKLLKGERRNEDSTNSSMFYYFYAYFLNDAILNVVCETNKKDIVMDNPICSWCEESNRTFEDIKVSNSIKPKKETQIIYYARGQGYESNIIQGKVVLSLTPVQLEDFSPLAMNLPRENILIELYKYESRQMKSTSYIYEYELDLYQMMLLNCSKTIPMSSSKLYFNETVSSKNEGSYAKYIPREKSLNNMILECLLRNSETNSVLSQIRILFLMKNVSIIPLGTTLPTVTKDQGSSLVPDNSDPNYLWIGVGGIVTLIVLVSVFIVIFKMKKRNHLVQGGSDSYENLQAYAETSIPPYPDQWDSNYAVINNPNDATRSNPNIDNLYAKAVLKNQREKKPDIIYANQESRNKLPKASNLDDLYARPFTDDSPDKFMYAEVLNGVPLKDRDKEQKTYANLSDNQNYVNSTCSEYAQPTYCELQH